MCTSGHIQSSRVRRVHHHPCAVWLWALHTVHVRRGWAGFTVHDFPPRLQPALQVLLQPRLVACEHTSTPACQLCAGTGGTAHAGDRDSALTPRASRTCSVITPHTHTPPHHTTTPHHTGRAMCIISPSKWRWHHSVGRRAAAATRVCAQLVHCRAQAGPHDR